MIPINYEDLYHDYHVALRKFCHTKAASLLWNMFHIDGIDRGAYFDQLRLHIQKEQPADYKSLARIIRNFSLDFGKTGNPQQMVLQCAFWLLEKDDYESIAYHLVNCGKWLQEETENAGT